MGVLGRCISSGLPTAGTCGGRVFPFTFEAHMGILALGGVGTGRVVEMEADGVTIFCLVIGTEGGAVLHGTYS